MSFLNICGIEMSHSLGCRNQPIIVMFKPLFNGFKIVGSEALASHESGEAKASLPKCYMLLC